MSENRVSSDCPNRRRFAMKFWAVGYAIDDLFRERIAYPHDL